MCTLSKRTTVMTLTPVNCPFVNQSPHRYSSASLYLAPIDPNARKENFREENPDKRASYLTWCAGKYGDSKWLRSGSRLASGNSRRSYQHNTRTRWNRGMLACPQIIFMICQPNSLSTDPWWKINEKLDNNANEIGRASASQFAP